MYAYKLLSAFAIVISNNDYYFVPGNVKENGVSIYNWGAGMPPCISVYVRVCLTIVAVVSFESGIDMAGADIKLSL